MSRCPQCGLANFEGVTACRRCASPLAAPRGEAAPSGGGQHAWSAPVPLARRNAATGLNGVGAFLVFILVCFTSIHLDKGGSLGFPIGMAGVVLPPAACAFLAGHLAANGKAPPAWLVLVPFVLIAPIFPFGTYMVLRIYPRVRKALDEADLTA